MQANGFHREAIPLNVLNRSFKYSPSLQNTEDISYTWYDLVVNNRGLGICGFGKTEVAQLDLDRTDHTSIVNTTVYDQELMGVPISESKSLRGGMPSLINAAVLSWSPFSTPHGKLSPRLTRSMSTDYLNETCTISNNTYDEFGYPLLSSIVSSDTASSDSISYCLTQNTYLHRISDTLYVLGSPLSIRNERSDQWAEDDYITRTEFIYDSGTLVPTERIDYDVVFYEGDTSYLRNTSRWEYDNYGNTVVVSTAPLGCAVFNTTRRIFSADGLKMMSSTSPFNKTTTYSNYNRFGSPCAVTDAWGRQTSYSYDNWGRQIAVNNPDGTRETTHTEWDNTGIALLKTVSLSSNKPSQKTYLNSLGQTLRSSEQRFDGAWLSVDYEYDNKGRIKRESLPYRASYPTLWNSYSYDAFGRKTSFTMASGRTDYWHYAPRRVTSTVKGVWSSTRYDILGRAIHVSQADGTSLSFNLSSDGQAKSIESPGGLVTNFSYDEHRRKTGMQDPGAGIHTWSYSLSADGSLSTSHTSPEGNVTTTVDRFGRMTSRTLSGGMSSEVLYDSHDRILEVYSSDGSYEDYYYDSFDRLLTKESSAVTGELFSQDFSYNTLGQLESIDYSSSFSGVIETESHSYSYGHETEVDISDGTLIWRLEDEDNLGLPSTATTTEIVERDYLRDQFGFMENRIFWAPRAAGGVVPSDQGYSYDYTTHNLSIRSDLNRDLYERFSYDTLDRLISCSTDHRQDSQVLSYDSMGNLASDSAIGSFSRQDSTDPYKITGYSTPVTGRILPAYSISLNAMHLPQTVSGNGYEAYFTYGASLDSRECMIISDLNTGDEVLRRFYFDDKYEVQVDAGGEVYEVLYLCGNAYSAPVAMTRLSGDGYDEGWELVNIIRDEQGSVMVLADADGDTIQELSYDIWGRERRLDDWELPVSGISTEQPLLFRGYTGHEHIPYLGLINMNARIYDPFTATFLTYDEVVGDPLLPFAYNRYAYVLGNPVNYTDPDGEFVFTTAIIIATSIGAVVGGYQGYKTGKGKGASGWKMAEYIAGGSLVGGLSGFAGGAVGELISGAIAVGGAIGGGVSGMFAGYSAGFINGFGMNALGGGSFGQSLQAGFGGAMTGALMGGISGFIGGGIQSTLQGNRFIDGFSKKVDPTSLSLHYS